MALSATYRLLLLGLLPAAAIMIYVNGQNYDPGLINFQPSESQSSPLLSFFPPEIGNSVRTGQIRMFTKDNLYEYVNGHAEYFISAGFLSMAAGEYQISGSESEGPDAIVDIYDLGKGIQAFGILADESGGTSRILETGAAGFKSEKGISFVKGQYYVKVSSYNEKISLDLFAGHIDRRIRSGTDPFPEFARFPEIGNALHTRFIREAYRGLDFLNNVIEREYSIREEKMQISLFTGKEDAVNNLVQSFMSFFRDSEIEYDTIVKNEKIIYSVNDPYEGEWMLIPLSNSLFGVYGSYNDSIIDTLTAGVQDQRK